MMLGHVRDNFPRVIVALPGRNGMHKIEFIIDTGFDGELALPTSLLHDLIIDFAADRTVRLADGSIQRLPGFSIEIDWNDGSRVTEIMQLEGNPLLGVGLLAGNQLSVEMRDGGEVSIDEL